MTESSLTCEGLDGQLRLLRVYLIFHYGVNVRQHKLHTAHCGTQLPQSVGAWLGTLREKRECKKDVVPAEMLKGGILL